MEKASLSPRKMQSDNGDGTHANPVIYSDFPESDVIMKWMQSRLMNSEIYVERFECVPVILALGRSCEFVIQK
jgi:hypothetical protein